MLPSTPSSHMRMPPKRFTRLAATFASASGTAQDQSSSSGLTSLSLQAKSTDPGAARPFLHVHMFAQAFHQAALASVSETP